MSTHSDPRAGPRAQVGQLVARHLDWLPTGAARRLLAVASIYFLALGLSSVFVPIFLYGLGHDTLWVPIEVMVVCFVVMGTTGLWLQPLVHPDYRRLLPVGILAMGAFQISLGYIGVWWLLGISYGLGLSLFWTTFNTYLFAHTAGPRRVEHLTLLGVAVPGVAGVVGPVLGGFLASPQGLHLGLPAVFTLAGGLFVLAALLSTGLPAGPVGATSTPSVSAHRHPEFFRYAGVFFLSGVSDTSWIIYPLLVFALAGSSLLYLGLVSSVIALFTAGVSPLLGRWADRRSTIWVPAALGFSAPVVWLVGLGFATTLWEVVLLGLCSTAGGLQGAVLRGYAGNYPESQLASSSVEREIFIELGRLVNLGLVVLLVGTAAASIAHMRTYYVVVGLLSLSTPVWIVLTKLGSTAPQRGGATASSVSPGSGA